MDEGGKRVRMISTADFKNGMTIDFEGKLYEIVYFQHVKPGKGGAFVRTKLKDVKSGRVLDKTFRAGEKVEEIRLVRKPVQFSYTDGQFYYFMDQETFEQIPLPADTIGDDQLVYLKENMMCEALTRDEQPLSVELPFFVELEVAETEPGVRGDTAQGGTKRAKLETGAIVLVPLFVEIGDVIKVDRRENKYLERVSS